MSAACVSISSPVVTSVMRMRSACSCRHSAQRLRCSSGSPPVSITRCTRSARIASTWRSRSSGGDLALVGVRLPDVAHHAAAVAGAVHAQREDRQALEPMRDAAAGAARDLAGADHQCTDLESRRLPEQGPRIPATHVTADPSRDQPRRSVEHRRRRIDAARIEHARQRRLRHRRLAADHRHPHVAARGGDERVERTRLGRPQHRQVRAARRPRCGRHPSSRSNCAAPAPTVRANPSALSCRVACADCNSSSRSRSPLNRESLPSASRSASSNARTSAVASNRNWFDEGHQTSPAPARDHAIGGGAAKRDAVNEDGVRRQAAEAIERVQLGPRRIVEALAA